VYTKFQEKILLKSALPSDPSATRRALSRPTTFGASGAVAPPVAACLQVNRLSKHLRNQFYHRRIEGLRISDPHDWWCRTKQLIGQQVKPQLQSFINDTAGGDVQLLADLINNALLQVSRDLTPLSDVSVPEITDIPN
jgi:hypothetical protein